MKIRVRTNLGTDCGPHLVYYSVVHQLEADLFWYTSTGPALMSGDGIHVFIGCLFEWRCMHAGLLMYVC